MRLALSWVAKHRHAQGNNVADIENVAGSSFGDTITGDNLVNLLVGGAGNDTLSGDGRANELQGGTGSDTLDGGIGHYTLAGGGDAYLFVLSHLEADLDSISDYDAGVDIIQVDAAGIGGGLAAGTVLTAQQVEVLLPARHRPMRCASSSTPLAANCSMTRTADTARTAVLAAAV